jgi:hypothetical protein
MVRYPNTEFVYIRDVILPEITELAAQAFAQLLIDALPDEHWCLLGASVIEWFGVDKPQLVIEYAIKGWV